ncbi:hypothetical protein [Spirosoma arcticum]
MNPQPDEEDDFLTPERVFSACGTVQRSNYRRGWTGHDYRIKCGRYKAKLLSEVDNQKWITWALNRWYDELLPPLRRALIDQLNSLHT